MCKSKFAEKNANQIRHFSLATVLGCVFIYTMNSSPAPAQSFVVGNGQVVGSQTLTTPGDVGTIDAGGSVIAGGDAIGDAGSVDSLIIINNGVINAGSDAIDIDGDNATITNNGSITASDDGIEAKDGNTISNQIGATIVSGDDGIVADDGNIVTNDGQINASGNDSDGIRVDDNNTITNNGTINSGNDGIETGDDNTITNTGSVTAVDDALQGKLRSTIINKGTVISQKGDGVDIRDDGAVTNSGSITGFDDGVTGGNNINVTNSGSITAFDDGVIGKNDINVTNSGSITASDDGVTGRNNLNVTNSGTITASDDGVTGRSNVNVTNSGTVTANSGEGVHIDYGTVVNSGLIRGTTGILMDRDTAGAGIVINSGTIIGTAGIAIDLRAGDFNDTVTLETGSKTVGDILTGGGSDSLAVFGGADVSGVTLFDGGDVATGVDNFVDTLTFQNQSLSLPGTTIINWETLKVLGGSLTITDGALFVGTDPGQGVFVGNGGVIDGGAGLTLTGDLSILTGGTFHGSNKGTGIYSIIGSITNEGTMSTVDGSAGDLISVSGAYSGGGQFSIDVDFTNEIADRLNVGGNVAGKQSQIAINDISPTAASGEKVLLVDVTGTTMNDDFRLAEGSVLSGIYTYGLSRLGSQWYLTPAFNPVGSVYEIAPSALETLTNLPTLKQRVKQRSCSAEHGQTEYLTRCVWLRTSAEVFDIAFSSSTTGSSYSGSSGNLQIGYDWPIEMGSAGQWVLGLTTQAGMTLATAKNMLGSARVKGLGYGLGATATWYGDAGFYFDSQTQVNWLGVDYNAIGISLASGETALGYGMSAEIGKHLKLTENNALIPQAQLNWSSVYDGTFTDSQNNTVALRRNDSLLGRVGLTFEHLNVTASGRPVEYYAAANLLHDFSDSSVVNVNNTHLSTHSSQTWAEFNVGMSRGWNESNVVYAETSYRRTLGSANGQALEFRAGLKMKW